MKTGYLKYALAAVVAAASTPVLANGLALNEQSASTAGTAYAGRASTANDASTIYGNPAGMSRLDTAQVTVGGAFIMADTEISNVQGGLPGGTNEGDMVPDSLVPFVYYATPIDDKLSFGFGIYVPFGVESDYEDTFAGRVHGLQSKVQVISFQPTLSYQVTDRVSVGAGVSVSRIDGKLTNYNPLTGSEVKLEGDDVAAGLNLGVLVAVTDNLDWGLTYHSSLDFDLTGDISGLRNPLLPASLPASLSITMPASVDTSFTYELNQWTFFAGATWTGWSSLETLAPKTGIAKIDKASKEKLNWEDTMSYAIGASYQLNPQWVLRAGVALDESPTSDEYRTVRIPVSDRTIVTIGAGWTPTPSLTIDMAYAYVHEDEGDVNYPKSADKYAATYENSAHGFSAQMTYRF